MYTCIILVACHQLYYKHLDIVSFSAHLDTVCFQSSSVDDIHCVYFASIYFNFYAFAHIKNILNASIVYFYHFKIQWSVPLTAELHGFLLDIHCVACMTLSHSYTYICMHNDVSKGMSVKIYLYPEMQFSLHL